MDTQDSIPAERMTRREGRPHEDGGGKQGSRGQWGHPRRGSMAKNGLRVMDSDLHVVEPRTLWEDYLDPKFRGRIVTVPGDYGSTRAHVDGRVMPPYADRPERQRAWSFRYQRPGAERLHRGSKPKEALEAMDI